MVTGAQRRNKAVLEARDGAGEVVKTLVMDVHDYYDRGVHMIDSEAHRKARGIRVIEGWLHGSSGKLEQHFLNRYDAEGVYIEGRTEHAGGKSTKRDLRFALEGHP